MNEFSFGITDILVLLGSLGLFLYGMKVMSDALMEVAGDKMRNILASMTSNRVFAVFTGFLITAVIQSSSATTLMVVSFVNASLLTLAESVGVIMGANIGTTVTAWLIAILGFKVSMSAIALPLVGLGFLFTFSKNEKANSWGSFIIGFAVLFIGLQFLKDSVPDIKNSPEILEWVESYTDMGYLSVLLFLLIGTILTVVIQSSSATMALTLVMCNEGWIPFDMAAAMVLGENIGTTITANLAALVANYNAKRTARAHFIFNMMGVVWMLILFYPFLNGVDLFVTQGGNPSPFVTATAVPVALSVFHTAFNIINTTLLIFFVPLIVRIVTKMVPYVEEVEPGIEQPKYLSRDALRYPQTALQALYMETKRLFEGAGFEVVAHGLNLHREDILSDMKLKKLVKSSLEPIDVDVEEVYYKKVKTIYSKIVKYATLAQSKFKISPEKQQAIANIKIAARDIVEAIKDTQGLQKNVDRYMVSDNPNIAKEYNKLRKKMSRVLRGVYMTKSGKEPKKFLEQLESLKEKVRKSDILTDGSLDKLIRNDLISSEMASSLANDSDNVANISKNLVNVAELLYMHKDTLLEEEEDKKKEKKRKKK